MTFFVQTAVDEDLSIDPSYIIRYQVYENGHFIGDGVTQYYRLAKHNDFHIPDTIVTLNKKPLSKETKNEIIKKIYRTVEYYLNKK